MKLDPKKPKKANKKVIQNKLNAILNTPNVEHYKKIMKEKTIKDAFIYCKINKLTGQSGSLIENYVKIKYGMKKNNARLCKGDLSFKKKNFEIKISSGGTKNQKFNYVHLRPTHNCEYLLMAYYINKDNLKDLGELFIFNLKKEKMKKLIIKYGMYACGTIDKLGKITKENIGKNNTEYAIRPKYGDDCWNELMKSRIDDIIL
jgi:hypothetical protein